MSFAFTEFKRLLAVGSFNWGTADIRFLWVMTNTTADTEEDSNTISGFTTLDVFDGANYVRTAFGAESVDEDNVNNRAELKSTTPITMALIGPGTRAIQAMIIFRFVTNDADSPPLVFIDSGGFPITANGADITVTMNAEGWIQIT